MKKKQVKIDILDGENENSKIFVLSQNIRGLSTYERAKAINTFVNRETNVLKTCLDSHVRHVLVENDILPDDGSQSALNDALLKLEAKKGKQVVFYDRYGEYECNETVIGQSPLNWTCINESDTLSCAIEIEVRNCG